ncbi:double-strand break repair helicase AddA [Dinoroseobacter shibae DFL 12 = DSM 16493]|jgi:ATP-dependent helicase/nuclease subunit A|uniref:DNA 3'-5' helicase n=2 Tax=Pseudomonadota TaxID=1224 RepID=A8LPA6_DINSH|nr:double-strand break repair helicase AddA [Dinoroseobacter shibae]ABV95171.1 double-strand break repair helicase AddA [Dinoroseobacter shibae DFL 12 = DSM 16493]URF46584.1 double-strand break repair helicase AddA [Dinoroseobacter shibae]URF50890.1 double-strand break repair helicase AddA [Dinoroseobacter shibae]
MTAPAPNDATRAQIAAADPTSSVWLSANAGSGKTKVLTDRVARLLLEDVPPERILCLTYTKAAASEMQNRLFRTLGGWSMLDDGDLRRRLAELGLLQVEITAARCRSARTLFARAIETPGGLKIQTIHSFCASLLRRFPMEAGVSPQFTEMDSRAEAELQRAVLRQMAEGPGRDSLFALAQSVDETNLPELMKELLSHREALTSPPAQGVIEKTLGLAPGDSITALSDRTFQAKDRDLIGRVAKACATGSSTDAKAAAKLQELADRAPDTTWFEVLEGLLLYGATAKAGPFAPKTDAFPTKATRTALGADMGALNDLMCRVAEARQPRLALEIAAQTRIVHNFANVFLKAYQAGKDARGWLDFDDLILRAKTLLTDPGVAQWVLFRLDGGIDHMLVDEAQDTSPVQWDVIRLLTREFTAGQGARTNVLRTIFVVGDQKQSIYSFQGADPAGFDRMRQHFGTELAQVGTPLQERLLLFSFRSSRAVLRHVDETFSRFQHQGLGGGSEHIAFHEALPGRVDLWPALAKAEKQTPQNWTDPVDKIAADDPRHVLARKIAAEIRRLLESGTQITSAKGETRPITPGDFLVLVQKRSEIFHELIRACKTERLPIAGSDRLRVGAELAVQDLMALLAFAATPEDSMALACVLRSPLCGWTQRELHVLAQPNRNRFLWAALRDSDAHGETRAFLQDVRDQADFLRPYDLLERVLTRHGGRERLIARLGEEAEEGIDVLLDQALQYEQTEIPSLSGFVAWFRQDDMSIKRQIDARRDEIRVMTVHGAKGLEAPIVIMPDCAKPSNTNTRSKLLPLEDGPLVWAGNKETRPEVIKPRAEEIALRDTEERMRLLYVAMTRAESWLIVAAAGETGTGTDSWHAMVTEGIEAQTPHEVEFPTGTGLRLEHGVWPPDAPSPMPLHTAHSPQQPAFAPMPPMPERRNTRAPSDLGGAKVIENAIEGLDKDAAQRRGKQIHLLLEHLPDHPPESWASLAPRLLGAEDNPETVADLLAEARGVLENPALEPLFAPDTLAEVSLTAPLPGLNGAQILGTVDRLIIGPERIVAVDFKSNQAVPAHPEDTPEGLLRQMGAYAEALAAIYPDMSIETAILWTRTATLMPLPHGLVIAALQRTPPA